MQGIKIIRINSLSGCTNIPENDNHGLLMYHYTGSFLGLCLVIHDVLNLQGFHLLQTWMNEQAPKILVAGVPHIDTYQYSSS